MPNLEQNKAKSWNAFKADLSEFSKLMKAYKEKNTPAQDTEYSHRAAYEATRVIKTVNMPSVQETAQYTRASYQHTKALRSFLTNAIIDSGAAPDELLAYADNFFGNNQTWHDCMKRAFGYHYIAGPLTVKQEKELFYLEEDVEPNPPLSDEEEKERKALMYQKRADMYNGMTWSQKKEKMAEVRETLEEADKKAEGTNQLDSHYRSIQGQVKEAIGYYISALETTANLDEFISIIDQKGADAVDEFVPDADVYTAVEDLGAKADLPNFEKQISECYSSIQNPSAELVRALADANEIITVGDGSAVDYSGNLDKKVTVSASTNARNQSMEELQRDDTLVKQLGLEGILDTDRVENLTLKSTLKSDTYAKVARTILQGRTIGDDLSKYDVLPDSYNPLQGSFADAKGSSVPDSFWAGAKRTSVLLDEDRAEEILDVINKIKKYGLFDSSMSVAESGSKLYGLQKLADCKKELQDAIEAKNPEAVIAARNKYRETEKHIDEVIRDLKDLNPDKDICPANVGPGRESGVPAKYRIDPIGVSRLAGIWQLMNVCQRCGIENIEEVINDPFKLWFKALEHAANNTVLDKYTKENSLADLIDLQTNPYAAGSNEYQSALAAPGNVIFSAERALEGLLSVIGEDVRPKLTVELELLTSALNQNFTNFINSTKMEIDNDNPESVRAAAEKMGRLIIAEPKDRNLFALNPEADKFIKPGSLEICEKMDMEKYVTEGKTTPGAVFDRICNVMEYLANPPVTEYGDTNPNLSVIFEAVKHAAKEMDKVPKSDTVKTLFETIKSSKTYPVEFHKTDLANYNAEKEYSEIVKDGINTNNVKDAISRVAKLKEEYSKRNIFARIFYSSVRRQSSIIDKMQQDLRNSGIKPEHLDAALKYADNKEKQKEFDNLLSDVKKDLSPEEEKIQDVSTERAPTAEAFVVKEAEDSYVSDNREISNNVDSLDKDLEADAASV